MLRSSLNQPTGRLPRGKQAAKLLVGRSIISGNFDSYQLGIMHEWLTTLSLLAVFLVPGFFILDLFMMPANLLPKFAIYRGISTFLALAQFFVILRSKPGAWSYLHVYFLSIQVGAIISLMTVDLGGFNSSYYAGLNLIVMATNLLMPWKTIHTVINSSLILLMYVGINLLSGLPFSPATLLNNLFFLSATALIAASINWVRFNLTKNEFVLLVNLEKSRYALQGEKELVEERNKSIKGLLDVSEQGFLSFDNDFKVSAEFSKECERIFGCNIVGMDIATLLYSEPKAAREFRTALQLYFSGKLKGDVVFDILDHSLLIGPYTVELALKAVSATRVMLALTDITTKLRFQEKLNAENERKIMILNVVSNRSAFASFLNEVKELSTEFSHRLHSPEILLRMIHTFKANAGFLGFRKTNLAAHELEDFFADRLAIGLPADLAIPVAHLRLVYSQEHAEIIDALGSKWQIDADSIEVPRRIFDQIEQQLKTGKSNHTLMEKMASYKMKPLSELFVRFPQMINDLALRLGKRIGPVVINISHTPVFPEDYEGLIESFAHLIRNIVDHGIELPMDREAKGKALLGTVTIDSKETANGFVFSFSDDGQGLQLGEIAQKAKEAGLIDNVSTASPQELLGFIFRDNFSTSPHITDISGRGVGLAAVKHAVKQMNGRIKVNTRRDQGTVFTINIPRIRLLNKELLS